MSLSNGLNLAEMTPEAAAAYRRVIDNARSLRDAQAAPQAPPPLHLRQGIIVARDPVTYTCSVLLGAADLADVAGDTISGVKLADTVYPIIGKPCFVAMNGSNPTVLFTVGSKVGACRARRTVATSVTGGQVTPIPLGINEFDTESDQTAGLVKMHDPAVNGTRIYARWPGHYGAHGGCSLGPESAQTGVRLLCDIRHTYAAGGSNFIARTEDRQETAATARAMQAGALDFTMADGDYVELTVFHGHATPINVETVERFSPVLELTWKGPP